MRNRSGPLHFRCLYLTTEWTGKAGREHLSLVSDSRWGLWCAISDREIVLFNRRVNVLYRHRRPRNWHLSSVFGSFFRVGIGIGIGIRALLLVLVLLALLLWLGLSLLWLLVRANLVLGNVLDSCNRSRRSWGSRRSWSRSWSLWRWDWSFCRWSWSGGGRSWSRNWCGRRRIMSGNGNRCLDVARSDWGMFDGGSLGLLSYTMRKAQGRILSSRVSSKSTTALSTTMTYPFTHRIDFIQGCRLHVASSARARREK